MTSIFDAKRSPAEVAHLRAEAELVMERVFAAMGRPVEVDPEVAEFMGFTEDHDLGGEDFWPDEDEMEMNEREAETFLAGRAERPAT